MAEEQMVVKLDPVKGVTNHKVLSDTYHFQCPPLESYKITHGYDHTDYQTIGGVTYSRKGAKQLRTLTFQTLIVDWASFARDFYDWGELTNRLIDVCESGTPFQITVTTGYEATALRMLATLRNFDVEERAGEPDARYFDLQFTEWRNALMTRKSKPIWPKRHKLVRNTTLAGLAKLYYGKPSLAGHIARANHIRKWGYNTPLVNSKRYKIGDTVLIPAPPAKVISDGGAAPVA